MFSNCKNLQYINLNKSIGRSDLGVQGNSMFNNTQKNIVICIDISRNPKINLSIAKIECPVIDCSAEWKKNQKKLDPKTQICYDTCKEFNKYEFEYDCIDSCPTGYVPNDGNICEIQIIPSTETDSSI